MTGKDSQNSAEEIEKTFQEYVAKIKALQKEQNLIVAEFVQKLEQHKMDKIRNIMKNA